MKLVMPSGCATVRWKETLWEDGYIYWTLESSPDEYEGEPFEVVCMSAHQLNGYKELPDLSHLKFFLPFFDVMPAQGLSDDARESVKYLLGTEYTAGKREYVLALHPDSKPLTGREPAGGIMFSDHGKIGGWLSVGPPDAMEDISGKYSHFEAQRYREMLEQLGTWNYAIHGSRHGYWPDLRVVILQRQTGEEHYLPADVHFPEDFRPARVDFWQPGFTRWYELPHEHDRIRLARRSESARGATPGQ